MQQNQHANVIIPIMAHYLKGSLLNEHVAIIKDESC